MVYIGTVPGLFVPKTFVPKNEQYLLGTFVPETFCSRALSFS